MTDAHLKLDNDTVAILIPAFIGAVVGVTRSERKTWKQSLLQIISGTSTAYFIGPATADWFKINQHDNSNLWSALIFIIGLVGFSVIPMIINLSRNLIKIYLTNFGNSNDK